MAKTTIELPETLLLSAKQHAVAARITLKALIESGLRHELQNRKAKPSKIRWVTVKGGLPPGLNISSRARMAEWIVGQRS